ncbi:hypothetical protein PYW07_006743 [Mythimna separata]|uniref:RdRp catalytic domain-containing protein n=1 Tax=Mythimna separata TaxID=271217 RepID=A0AAD8DWS2_MYTSE|nr:hypothetical protein PYW07_006743 [Mythimna separata]
MQKLIKTTIKERRTTGNTNNSPFSFEYTFEDDALTYDEKAERKTSKCNLNNNSQKHLEERNTEKQQENNIIGQEKDQDKQNRSLKIQNEKVEELDQDVENEKIQEDDPETQTDEATNSEIEEIVSNGSDDDTGENLSSDIISEDEDNIFENISESEGGELEGDKDWIDIPDNDVLSFDESILDSVTNKFWLAELWKTVSHTVVNMDESTKSWFAKGTVLKTGLEPATEQINNMFKKEFCRQFYKLHKRWPNVQTTPSTNPQILSCLHANEWDKAIIPGRSEWIHEYDTKAFRTLHGYFPVGPPPSTKSVVMHGLTTEIFDRREILGLIDKDIIPSEWRVMVTVPKEREFKENDARCFGKMSPEMRAYQVVTEKNIADTIFRYISP